MAKRIYIDNIIKWADKNKVKLGLAIGTPISFLIFYYLAFMGAITINSVTWTEKCAGTLEEPCLAFINFTANEDVFLYRGDLTKLLGLNETMKEVNMYRSWGTGWRRINFEEGCTGSWCGCGWCTTNNPSEFVYAFRNGTTYLIKIEGFKNNITDTVKWSFGIPKTINLDDSSYIDPLWSGYNKDDFFVKLIENKGSVADGYAIFELTNPFTFPIQINESVLDIKITKYVNNAKLLIEQKNIIPRNITDYSSTCDWITIFNITCPAGCKHYNCTIYVSGWHWDNITITEWKPIEEFYIYKATKISENITIYSEICSNIMDPNGTVYQDCILSPTGWELYTYKIPYHYLTLQPKQILTIKLEASWEPILGDNLREWIPKLKVSNTEFTQDTWAWWNTSYQRKVIVNVSNSDSVNHTFEPLGRSGVILDFTTNPVNASKEVRVVQCTPEGSTTCTAWTEVKSWVWNKTTSGGTDDKANINFETNVSTNSWRYYEIYYNYSGATDPNYKYQVMGDTFNRASVGSDYSFGLVEEWGAAFNCTGGGGCTQCQWQGINGTDYADMRCDGVASGATIGSLSWLSFNFSYPASIHFEGYSANLSHGAYGPRGSYLIRLWNNDTGYGAGSKNTYYGIYTEDECGGGTNLRQFHGWNMANGSHEASTDYGSWLGVESPCTTTSDPPIPLISEEKWRDIKFIWDNTAGGYILRVNDTNNGTNSWSAYVGNYTQPNKFYLWWYCRTWDDGASHECRLDNLCIVTRTERTCNSYDTPVSYSIGSEESEESASYLTWYNNQSSVVTTYSATTNSHFNITWNISDMVGRPVKLVILEQNFTNAVSNITLVNNTDLAGYWRFDEAIGISETDSSGNSNTGTYTGETLNTGTISVTETGWWNSTWSYKKQININSTVVLSNNFQVNITLDTQTLIGAGKMASDCSDIRVLNGSEDGELDFWVSTENGKTCNSGTTRIWVEAPSLAAGNTTIYVYYGNTSVVTTKSNCANTFIYCELANGASPDLSYTISAPSTIKTQSSVVYEGAKSLNLTRVSGGSGGATITITGLVQQYVMLESYMFHRTDGSVGSATNPCGRLELAKTADSSSWIYGKTCTGTGVNLGFYNGASWVTVYPNYPNGTWYKAGLLLNTSDWKFDIFTNDVLNYTNAIGFGSPNALNRWGFLSSGNDRDNFYDIAILRNATYGSIIFYYGNEQTPETVSPWTSSGKYSSALTFDGLNNYVNLGTGNNLDITTGTITMSAWVKFNSISGAHPIIDRNASYQYIVGLSSGNLYAYIGNGTTRVLYFYSANIKPTLNEWHHIAVTVNTTHVNLYIDGILNRTETQTVQMASCLNQQAYIGRSGTAYFNGTIDDIRLYNRSLSTSEITNMYDFNTFIRERIIAYWRFDEGSGTSAYDTHHITTPYNVNGTKYDNALSFDNVNDFVNITSNQINNVTFAPNSIWSVSFWFYGLDNNNWDEMISKAFTSHATPYYQYEIRWVSKTVEASTWNTAASRYLKTVSTTLNTNTWYHAVNTVDLVNNISKLYINGALVSTCSTAVGTYSNYNTPLTIGANKNLLGGTYAFNGMIDDVRIFNRSLSETEISYIYNQYHPDTYNYTTVLWAGSKYWKSYAQGIAGEWNVTPSWSFSVAKAQPIITLSNNTSSVNSSNLVGYWRFETVNTSNYTLDSSGLNNDGKLFNGTSSCYDSASCPQLVTGMFGNAISFDGVDDYISLTSSTTYDFGTGTSFLFWAKKTKEGNYIVLGNSGTSAYKRLIFLSGVDLYLETNTDNDACRGNIALDTNWHHYAVTVSNYICIFYQDGSLVTMTDSSVTNNVTFDKFGAGATFGYPMNGTLDEIMIFNRNLTADEVRLLYQSGFTYNGILKSNVSYSESNTVDADLTYNYYMNGTSVSNPDIDRPVGYRWYIVNTSGGWNFTKQEFGVLPYNISYGSTTIYEAINGTQADRTFGYPTVTNVSCWKTVSGGNLLLLRNNTIIVNVSNSDTIDHTFEPLGRFGVWINATYFAPPNATTAVRVYQCSIENSSNCSSKTEIPSWVWNKTTAGGADFAFNVNFETNTSAKSWRIYEISINNSASDPNYEYQIWSDTFNRSTIGSDYTENNASISDCAFSGTAPACEYVGINNTDFLNIICKFDTSAGYGYKQQSLTKWTLFNFSYPVSIHLEVNTSATNGDPDNRRMGWEFKISNNVPGCNLPIAGNGRQQLGFYCEDECPGTRLWYGLLGWNGTYVENYELFSGKATNCANTVYVTNEKVWRDLKMVWDGTDTYKLYVNDTLNGTVTNSSISANFTNANMQITNYFVGWDGIENHNKAELQLDNICIVTRNRTCNSYDTPASFNIYQYDSVNKVEDVNTLNPGIYNYTCILMHENYTASPVIRILSILNMSISTEFPTYEFQNEACVARNISWSSQIMDDAMIDSEDPNTNYGSANALWIKHVNYSGVIKDRWDLVKICTNKTTKMYGYDLIPVADRLKLGLYYSGLWSGSWNPANLAGNNVSMYYSLNETWNESLVTWNNIPSYYSFKIATENITTNQTWYYWDITKLQKSVNDVISLIMKPDDYTPTVITDQNLIFRTKEFETATQRPKIRLEFDYGINATSYNGTFQPFGQTINASHVATECRGTSLCGVGALKITNNGTENINVSMSLNTTLPSCMRSFIFSLNTTREGTDANVTNTTYVPIITNLGAGNYTYLFNWIDFINCVPGTSVNFDFRFNVSKIGVEG